MSAMSGLDCINGHMKKMLIVLLLAACTNSSKARETLEAAGFSDIEIGGWSYKCKHDEGGDDTCTSFTAKGPTGVRTSGAVGCGYFFKGCTIHY